MLFGLGVDTPLNLKQPASNVSEINPYASPLSNLEDTTIATGVENAGVWRMNDLLVVRKGATLPFRCVKTNEPAVTVIRKRVTWTSKWKDWVAVAIVLFGSFSPHLVAEAFGVLAPSYRVSTGVYSLFLIVLVTQLLFQRRQTIRLPLGAVWLAKRRRYIVISISICGVALFGFMFGYIHPVFPVLVLVLGCIALLMLGYFRYESLIKTERLTRDFAYLKEIHPAYLDQLPDWPHPSIR